ncbi:MAG: histidine kinase [Sphingobacteriales bacterium]|nr:histidine kinase [Sphingobacteriales bacterium]
MNWLKYTPNRIVLLSLLGVIVSGVSLFYLNHAIKHTTGYTYDKFIFNKRLEKAKALEELYGVASTNYYANPTKDAGTIKAIEKIGKTGWYRNKAGVWKHDDGADLLGIYQTLMLISIWLLIYIVYHYVEKNRNDQLDRLRLETTVKDLELKTIKSHINPHFIFNSLNSIRALVDENPERARKAITELSNILRSSLQASKSETVSFEKELNIVKDYLALEHMRFEERLQIVFDIDEKTLKLHVPPMMLQTLVENAIKHGLSKRVEGGLLKVTALFKNGILELIVQNSGQMDTVIKKEGFGIKSTEERLNLLYHGKASFEIKNLDHTIVQSRVRIPISI